MSINLTRRALLGSATALGIGAALGARAESPLKAGWVYVGPVGDYGYSYQHDLGRKAVEKQYGDQVKTTYVENVSEGPDAERVIRQLATTGNEHDLRHLVRLHEPDRPGRQAVPQGQVRARHRLSRPRPTSRSTTPASTRAAAVIGTIAGKMTKSDIVG